MTYLKSKFRWLHNAETWPYYKRVVGVGVDCDSDAQGYLINSDGSKTFVSDRESALILLFARTMAAKKSKLSIVDKARCALASMLLNI